jgi:hypothetical protein
MSQVVRLSSRQYAMLEAFASDPKYYMSIKNAGSFDQRSFGSMLAPSRKYVVYIAGKGFHLTKEGKDAYHDFLSADIARKVPSEKLTHYFDPTSYGLSLVSKKSNKKQNGHRKSEAA